MLRECVSACMQAATGAGGSGGGSAYYYSGNTNNATGASTTATSQSLGGGSRGGGGASSGEAGPHGQLGGGVMTASSAGQSYGHKGAAAGGYKQQ